MKQMQDDPSQATEPLSRLADGEVSPRELDRCVELLAEDAASRERFARYRLIGAHLGSEEAVRVDASAVADRVSARLDTEPAILSPRARHTPFSIPRVALGAALAAGVAVLAVGLAPAIIGLGEPEFQAEAPEFAFAPRLSVPSEGITLVAAGAPAVPSEEQSPESSAQRWKVLSTDMQQKLSRYLVEHNELAGHISAQRPSSHLSYISTHEVQD